MALVEDRGRSVVLTKVMEGGSLDLLKKEIAEKLNLPLQDLRLISQPTQLQNPSSYRSR